MKEKLSKIRSPWMRLYITLLIVVFYCRDKLLINPRARVHWIGDHRRPRRLERRMIVLLFLGAMLLLEPREYATWAAISGGFTAMLVPVFFFHYHLMRVLGKLD